MHAVIRIEEHREDNTGNPAVDWDTDYDVILFPDEASMARYLADVHAPMEFQGNMLVRKTKFYGLKANTSHLDRLYIAADVEER